MPNAQPVRPLCGRAVLQFESGVSTPLSNEYLAEAKPRMRFCRMRSRYVRCADVPCCSLKVAYRRRFQTNTSLRQNRECGFAECAAGASAVRTCRCCSLKVAYRRHFQTNTSLRQNRECGFAECGSRYVRCADVPLLQFESGVSTPLSSECALLQSYRFSPR